MHFASEATFSGLAALQILYHMAKFPFAKDPKQHKTENYGQVTKEFRHCKLSGVFGIPRAFRKASEEFRKERTRGQRIAPVDLEKMAEIFMSQNKKNERSY